MATITKISALARSVTGGTPHRWIIDFNDHEVGAESHIHKFYLNPHVGDEPFSACCQTCFKQYSIKIDSPNSRCNGLTHHLHTVFGTNLVDVECCHCGKKIYAQVEKPTLPLSLIRTLESNRGPNAKDVPDFPIAISALIKFFDDALDSNSTSVYAKGNSMTFDLGLDSTSKEIFDIAGFTLMDDWLHAPELNQASKQTLRSIISSFGWLLAKTIPRKSKTQLMLERRTRLRETDVGACFDELGCLSDMNDEWILEAFQTQVSHSPSSACGLVDSFMKIRARRTEVLDQEIASKRSQGIVCTSELEDAYRAFDIQTAAKMGNPLLNTLTGTPSDTPGPDTSTTLFGATPVGIGNIGSTCYLNSVIQYVYTVKDIREAVINMDPNDKHFPGLWKAVNRRILYKTKIIEAKEVALELRELFLEMRSAKDKEVKPSRRLVNLLFPPLSFPDEESPRQNPAYEQ
ncbi:MAG: hypothetical protein BYD32DRAFT_465293 [Podila humilis]|nr:MAG: hypothetical protein BYD32DRAFT_465293 [Podila humilis]